VTSNEWPSAAPPSAGAHYIMVDEEQNPSGSLWQSVGTAHPEDWIQLKGQANGYYADVNATSETHTIGRKIRLVALSVSYDLPDSQAAIEIVLPEWPVWREDLIINVIGFDGRSVSVQVDVRFPHPVGGVTIATGVDGVTAATGADFLRFTVTQDMRLTFINVEYASDDGEPIATYATVVPGDPGPTQWGGVGTLG
jgi:hypothetical protein